MINNWEHNRYNAVQEANPKSFGNPNEKPSMLEFPAFEQNLNLLH